MAVQSIGLSCHLPREYVLLIWEMRRLRESNVFHFHH